MPGTYKGIMALREAPLNVYQVNIRLFFHTLFGFYFTSSISEGRNKLEIDQKNPFQIIYLIFHTVSLVSAVRYQSICAYPMQSSCQDLLSGMEEKNQIQDTVYYSITLYPSIQIWSPF